MKTKIFGLTVGTAAIVFVLSGGILQSIRAQQETPPDAQAGGAQTSSEPADALPPDVAANGALVEVINMAQGGVSESVIQNYINNVQTPFSLTASQLIYLKDIGLSDSDVVAMQQRDQQLGQAAPPPTQTAAPAPPTTIVSDDGFNDSLAPYGNWVVIEGYGRCWRPAVVVYDSSWQPYCDHGHWVWTDDGWYWISDYSWGWATFHYGRWFRDSRYGWCWYPDTVWGPSWVCWRYSDDYCGWAPLPPHCDYREGVGLVFNGSHVSVGFDFGLSIGAFTFVATKDFCDPHPWQHRVDHDHVTQIYNHTTVINNFGGHDTTIINNGIPRDHIEAVTHTTIRQVTIRDSNTPVRRGERLEAGGNTLVVNRPHIEHAASQNENQPHTIPSPTTGSPMRVPQHNQPTTPAANEHGNGNFGNRNSQSPTMTPTPPTQTRTPTFTPPANQSVQPTHTDNTTREWRTMSPRMRQQQPSISPAPRDYSPPANEQPTPHVEIPQPEQRQPQQQAPQSSAPQQQQNRNRDKNDH